MSYTLFLLVTSVLTFGKVLILASAKIVIFILKMQHFPIWYVITMTTIIKYKIVVSLYVKDQHRIGILFIPFTIVEENFAAADYNILLAPTILLYVLAVRHCQPSLHQSICTQIEAADSLSDPVHLEVHQLFSLVHCLMSMLSVLQFKSLTLKSFITSRSCCHNINNISKYIKIYFKIIY